MQSMSLFSSLVPAGGWQVKVDDFLHQGVAAIVKVAGSSALHTGQSIAAASSPEPCIPTPIMPKRTRSLAGTGDVIIESGSRKTLREASNAPVEWEYPPPDLSPQALDWDTWQGNVPKRAFDPLIFARWRCWKEYGTGVAGDLLVHLISGMQYVMGINEPPKRAMAMGGILRWKDGRNMPDVHSTLFEYGNIPVYMRLNLGTETPEIYRFMGSKGILELTLAPRISHSPAWISRPAIAHLVFPRACVRPISSSGTRSTIRFPARSRHLKESAIAVFPGTR